MKNIIVELEDISGYWNIRDIYGVAWSTGITTSQVAFKEILNDEDKLKRVLKLKDAGFSADEILEMKKADLI